jgi:hypothetical protein
LSQVRTVIVAPNAVKVAAAIAAAGNLPAVQLKPEESNPVLVNPKKPIDSKVPQPYEKLVGKMSNRQLRGELKRVIKKAAFPRTPQAKFTGGRAMFDTAFAEILLILLDSHERGVNLYPR